MINKSNFSPPWWLQNPHLQTLWPKLFRPYPKIDTRRERLELPDGDFLDLNFTLGQSGPVVLVLHGLEGSLESKYAAGILKALHLNGYRAVLMHFRSCSGEPNRLPRSYHSGETQDPYYLMQVLQERFPDTPLFAIGYSLGGNAILKLLGELKKESPLTAAIAISVPFLLDQVAYRMNRGFSRIYQNYLMASLIKSTQKKHAITSLDNINISTVASLKTFWEFDDLVTAQLHGFQSADDYYTRCSSRQFLKSIETPTLIIHAADDPFMTPEVIPTSDELSNSIRFELSEHGGHVGFITGKFPGFCRYWLEERVVEYLNSFKLTTKGTKDTKKNLLNNR